MRAGPDLSKATDLTAVATVRVNGVIRKATNVKVAGSIGSDLPVHVVGGTGITDATGTITWAAQGDEQETLKPNPWAKAAGWPPSRGDAVTVDVTLTDNETGQSQTARKFTGTIESTSDGMVSRVRDLTDRLRRDVDIRPLQYAMPADDRTGAGGMATQLAALTPVSWALQQCGFYATPHEGAFIRMGLSGSFFPDVGFIASTRWASKTLGPPVRSKWGMAATVTGVAEVTAYNASGYTPATQTPHYVTVDFPKADGSAYVKVAGMGYEEFYIYSGPMDDNPSRRYIGVTRVRDFAYGFFQLPAGVGDFRATVRIGGGKATVRTEYTGAQEASVALNTQTPGTIAVTPWQATLGAIVYRAHDYGWADLTFDPSAKFNVAPYGLYSSLGIHRTQRGHTGHALDLIKDAASSLMACVWIDEDGVFRWVDGAVLSIASPSATVTSTDNLVELPWEDEASGYRRVSLAWDEPSVSGGPTSPNPWVILFQGSGRTMKRDDDPQIEFVNAAAEEEWILPETAAINAAVENRNEIAQGWGTWSGGMVTDANGNNPNYAGGWAWTTIEKLGYRALKITYDARNPNADDTVTWKIFSGIQNWGAPGTWVPNTMMPEQWRNAGLPIVRGWGKTVFTPQKTVIDVPGAPPSLGDYTHEGRHWFQSPGHAQSAATYLSQRFANMQPIVKRCRIKPDVRLQRGDVIRVQDTHGTGADLQCVIFGEELEVDASGYATQLLDLRVAQVNPNSTVTVGAVDAFHAGRTVSLTDGYYGTRTVDNVDSNPI